MSTRTPGPNVAVRGIRASIPSGYILGRLSAGPGAAELIPINGQGGLGSSMQQSGSAISRLAQLQDVSLSALGDKQRLRYSLSIGKWVNVSDTLANLTDVNTTGVLTGSLLQFSGTAWVPYTLTYTLAGASDVTISSPSNGQVLTYNSATGKWANAAAAGGSTTLAALTDVALTPLIDKQILQYNAGTGKWVNVTLTGPSTTLIGSLSATQTGATSGVFTKVNVNSIALDTLSAWDNVNHRYKPPAGLYIFIVTTGVDVIAGGYGGAALYKNGTQVVNNLVPTGSGAPGVGVVQACAAVDFNGTTDYVEVFAIGSSAGSPNFYAVTPTANITGIRLGNSGSTSLAGDTDVAITTPADKQALIYVASASKWENITLTFAYNSDVLITSPANGDLLTYDTATSKWLNKPAAAATSKHIAFPSGQATSNDVGAFATLTNYFIPSTNITVDQLIGCWNTAVSGDIYSMFIATCSTLGDITGTVATATTRFATTATGFVQHAFDITPVTLVAGTPYLIALVITNRTTTTGARAANSGLTAYTNLPLDFGLMLKNLGGTSCRAWFTQNSDAPTTVARASNSNTAAYQLGLRWS